MQSPRPGHGLSVLGDHVAEGEGQGIGDHAHLDLGCQAFLVERIGGGGMPYADASPRSRIERRRRGFKQGFKSHPL